MMTRARRGTTTACAALVLATMIAVTGCGQGIGAVTGGGPPPVTVRGDGDPLDLAPWTWCRSGLTGGSCSDGMPPQDPPDVGAAEEVTVSFPEPGWIFAATFRRADQACAREQRVDLATAPSDDGSTSGGTLAPAGPAGVYDVDLSGRGSGGNDVNVTFRWTTPFDGPAAVPEASIAVLDEYDDGQVAGYGVSLAVSGLATTPRRASAHVTVTSSEGASLGLDPAELRGTCSPEGSVWFDGAAEGQEDIASLGSAPFTYDVVLTLDGVEHRATATWPRDERPGPDESSDTPLRFTPPLPALTS